MKFSMSSTPSHRVVTEVDIPKHSLRDVLFTVPNTGTNTYHIIRHNCLNHAHLKNNDHYKGSAGEVFKIAKGVTVEEAIKIVQFHKEFAD